MVAVGEQLLSVDSQSGAAVAANPVAAVAGPFADAEALTALRDLVHRFNSELLCTEESFPVEKYVLRSVRLL